MSGHSKWSQIKHQKGAADAKKSRVFSKIARTIAIAARKGEDPGMNPDLRVAINKAKEANMPADNIEKAIQKSLPAGRQGAGKLEGAELESFRFEAYLPVRQAGGPAGTAIIIEGITDNKNRTIAEIKHILSKHNAKWAETGSVTWAFNPPVGGGGWLPKHTIEISESDARALDKFLEELGDHDDVQEIYNNAS